MDMSNPLLLEVAAEIDTNQTSFIGVERGVAQTVLPVIGSRSALAMSVHPTYFDLATPLETVPSSIRPRPTIRRVRRACDAAARRPTVAFSVSTITKEHHAPSGRTVPDRHTFTIFSP